MLISIADLSDKSEWYSRTALLSNKSGLIKEHTKNDDVTAAHFVVVCGRAVYRKGLCIN